ncbi:MAG: hypothetical protein PUP93_27400 [Rhizonema sp. NSF051]|nr:hypothetical protein [Rhizonema sp. NSF051]
MDKDNKNDSDYFFEYLEQLSDEELAAVVPDIIKKFMQLYENKRSILEAQGNDSIDLTVSINDELNQE